jgi:hypothetical protein
MQHQYDTQGIDHNDNEERKLPTVDFLGFLQTMTSSFLYYGSRWRLVYFNALWGENQSEKWKPIVFGVRSSYNERDNESTFQGGAFL